MPAQQLRNRLNTVFSDRPWRDLQALAASAGDPIVDVKAMVVHETSGWPPRSNGVDMFNTAFRPPETERLTTQLYVSGDGTVLQGMQLPNHTNHAGFVNDRALGCETGHGWGNFASNQRLGPHTSTDETHGGLIPPVAMPLNHWLPLSGNANDDLPGIKFWVRHKSFTEVAVGIWTTARYAGPWRQPQRVPEMLFTEAQYRSWALLARWVAEEYLLPRNFSVLPHKVRAGGFGDVGSHSVLRDATSFSAIVLADEGLSRSPQTFGLSAMLVPPTAAALRGAYAAGMQVIQVIRNKKPVNVEQNRHWQAMFTVYRGFHGHGYSGDPWNGDHDCPGPMFDWHRFAREVWDWWWWPFDFDTAKPNDPVAERPYSLATRDGNTPLKEYFWSIAAAVPQGRVRTGVHGARSSPATFELPENSRIYALANGELVAARFPIETGRVSLGFMLVRHEVFHRLDARPPAVFANRIDYDVAPTTVYSLYMHLARSADMDFLAVADTNPDWLNRVLARRTESSLGVAFRATTQGGVGDIVAKWDDRPPGGGRRPTLIEAWRADKAGLTTFLDTLMAGDLAVVPLDADATPVHILLGDYLANAGVIFHNQATTLDGVRVEVFSNTLVSHVEFSFTDSSATGGGWNPSPGTGPPAVQYASEWARTPIGAELLTLSAAGVDTNLVNWWPTVQLASLHPRFYANNAALPATGLVTHYDPMTFLPWLNRRTWRSEWPKYRANDPAGIPAVPRPR